MNSEKRLLTPRAVAILTCGEHFCPVTRFSPVSSTPLMYMVSLLQTSRTAAEIIEREEFTLNFVEWDHRENAHKAGFSSGWDIEKWNEIPFTRSPSAKVASPRLEEAYAGYECADVNYEIVGNAYVFFGAAVEFFGDDRGDDPHALLYWGKETFGGLPYSNAQKQELQLSPHMTGPQMKGRDREPGSHLSLL